MFITGSGGNGLTKHLGAKFVQEVNAVSLAVERLDYRTGPLGAAGMRRVRRRAARIDPGAA